MGAPPNSQVAPLPSTLPFRLVSKTIGSGAYASIRKAVPLNSPGPVIAVKFINKDHAFRTGRLRPRQLQLELGLHARVCPHDHIIRYLSHGEDAAWVWMALELAEGGDLFDKIEADEGVGEDIAHFYFAQLVSAVGWCHGKGVAHRDIKPENMLLSAAGDLKLADFGLATQFLERKSGQRKVCGMVCGSPPYIAAEILAVGRGNCKRKEGEDKAGYDPQGADVWSCAIVLFVLLCGNTPWDSPVLEESYEYYDYVTSNGRPKDELWASVPAEALSLLRAMLKVDTAQRFSLDDVRKHPWFTRRNRHLNADGKAADPIGLATQMIQSLHIDFDADIPTSQPSQRQSHRDQGAMHTDTDPPSLHLHPNRPKLASTQPETPVSAPPFDWEAPPRLALGSAAGGFSASQPSTTEHSPRHSLLLERLCQDPAMSQFTPTPSVPLTLTQQARAFNDILPSHSLARFLSALPMPQLLPLLATALHRLSIPLQTLSPAALQGREQAVSLRIKTVDGRQQPLHGSVVVERMSVQSHDHLLEVRFLKAKGDPLEWRRLFKRVAVLCKDGIVKPHS